MTVLVRLGDNTGGAPFYAGATTLGQIPRHQRVDYIDITLCVEGQGQHVLYLPNGEQRRRALLPGAIVMYRPGDEMSLSGTGPHGLRIRHVAFPMSDWEDFALVVGLDRSWFTAAEPLVVKTNVGAQTAVQPFETAFQRFLDGPTSLDLVRFWIDVIPFIFTAYRRRLEGEGAPEWLTECREAMRDEQNLRGGVARMVELAHVTSNHLAASTRRYFGMTPTEVVSNLRIRHAAILLITTSESIGSIARRCGFGSFAYFSSSFRRAHHVSPREYRTRSRGRFGIS